MLKKLIKMGVVMSLLVTSVSAFAQKAEYPRYGFWSNWSIGGAFDLNHQFQMGPLSFGDDWCGTTNVGMDIFLQHKLNHAFDIRYRYGHPTFCRPRVSSEQPGYLMDRHHTATVDVLWSINNTIAGYDPDRRWSIYALIGGGLAFSANHDSSITNFGSVGIALVGGLGTSYRFGEAHNLFLEYTIDVNGDAPNPFDNFFQWHHTNGIARLGYFYCFGPTATDKAIAAQKAMLTQENFSALNSQVNNLERQVANSRNNEKRLENRIAELEDQLAQALAQGGKGGNSAAADSLQAVIDQIKADQLNFYAMPFSVLYGVDEWKVVEDEEAKVKAVARVLKDNPDVNILVVGFADYTGSDAYNMKLSEKRANEVKRLLTKRYGIAEDRIQTEYKGKSVAFGDIQYALNRRVSFYRVIE